MLFVAGVLLGLVVLAALIGFHSGPHAHVAAGVIGLVAAVWLVLTAVRGRSSGVVWVLLSADVVISAGVGIVAWRGFSSLARERNRRPFSIEGAEGTALTELSPEGIVRVRGEQWSAVSASGPIRAGATVRVLRSTGVRLEVFGEEPEAPAPPDLFSLESRQANESKEAP